MSTSAFSQCEGAFWIRGKLPINAIVDHSSSGIQASMASSSALPTAVAQSARDVVQKLLLVVGSVNADIYIEIGKFVPAARSSR